MPSNNIIGNRLENPCAAWLQITRIFVLASLLLGSESVFAFGVGLAPSTRCGWVDAVTFESCSATDLFTKGKFSPIHQSITERALNNIFYTRPVTPQNSIVKLSFARFMRDAIIDANKDTDKDQTPYLHFDDERFSEAIERVQKLFSEILERLALKYPLFLDAPGASLVRQKIGTALHTIQDFYSHTNWIYYNPGTIPKFWDSSDPFLAALQADVSNTEPCEQAPPEDLLDPVPRLFNVPPFTGYYTRDDGVMFPTSGYAWGAANLVVALAPRHKCAHGFFGETLDDGTLSANYSGIHKDWPGRKDHEIAAAAAQAASEEFLKDILDDPSVQPQNACMLMTDLPCPTEVNVYVNTNPGDSHKLRDGEGRVTSLPAGIDCGDSSQSLCQTVFQDGFSTTLTAVAAKGSTFAGWTGAGAGACAASTSPSCIVPMDGGKREITALFSSQCGKPSFDEIIYVPETAPGMNPGAVSVSVYARFSCLRYDSSLAEKYKCDSINGLPVICLPVTNYRCTISAPWAGTNDCLIDYTGSTFKVPFFLVDNLFNQIIPIGGFGMEPGMTMTINFDIELPNGEVKKINIGM